MSKKNKPLVPFPVCRFPEIDPERLKKMMDKLNKGPGGKSAVVLDEKDFDFIDSRPVPFSVWKRLLRGIEAAFGVPWRLLKR